MENDFVFTITVKNFLPIRILFTKFSSIWSCGCKEEIKEFTESLHTDGRSTAYMKTEKLTNFLSGEKKAVF